MADAYFVTRQTKRTGQGQKSIIRIYTFGTNHTRKKKKKKKKRKKKKKKKKRKEKRKKKKKTEEEGLEG